MFVRLAPAGAYDGILGLGAGLMLAAATLGLLSEAVHDVRVDGAMDWGRLGLIVVGFVVGVGIAAMMDRFIPHHHAGGHHEHLGHEPGHDVHDRHHQPDRAEARRGYAVVGALTLHRIPEGLAIGAGFAAPGSSHLGLLLAIAVGGAQVFVGLVTAALRLRGGVC